ncbi:MAG: YkvA family protein [Endomicrobiales bacterium]
MGKKLKALMQAFKQELDVYRLVLKDPRTPKAAKTLLALAVAYALSPVDLIPDFIPVLGHLDDLVIVPLLVYLALKLIPKEIIEDARRANPLQQ